MRNSPRSTMRQKGLTSRLPLMITVTVHLDDGDQTVIVINSHFLSMSGVNCLPSP